MAAIHAYEAPLTEGATAVTFSDGTIEVHANSCRDLVKAKKQRHEFINRVRAGKSLAVLAGDLFADIADGYAEPGTEAHAALVKHEWDGVVKVLPCVK